MTARTPGWRLLLCISLASFGTAGAALQTGGKVAAVKGWRGDATRIRVFNRDGTRQTPGQTTDLSAARPNGLLEWDTDFDLIKLTADPRDTRWVLASDLDLVFCANTKSPEMAGRGSTTNNKGITMGSGAACP